MLNLIPIYKKLPIKNFFINRCIKKRAFSFPSPSIDIPQKIALLDEEFSTNNYQGLTNSPSITTLEGKNNILLSAPHAVSHFRNKRLKHGEQFTGGIVKYLHEKTHSHAIIKSKTDGTDPNWINGTWYKNQIMNITKKNNINFLIDLHALNPNRENEIVLCTNNLKNIQEKKEFLTTFISILKMHGFKNIEVDTIYKANASYNISNYISKKAGIPCLQIEINTRLLNPKNANKLKHFLLALEDYINTQKK